MSNHPRRAPAPIVGCRGLPRPVPYDLDDVGAWVAEHGPTPTERRRLDEWQYAADLAELALMFDACRMFGLVTGGPNVNADRAHAIIEQAARRGVEPAPTEAVMAGFIAGLLDEPAP